MDKICLIVPPSEFLLDDKVFMSLGILQIAAVLEQKGICVKVLDLSGDKTYLETLSEYVSNSDFLIYGITVNTSQLPNVFLIAKLIKKLKKNSKIILGGPHITLAHSSLKNNKTRILNHWNNLINNFDVLVSGDGEEAMFEALKSNHSKLIDSDLIKRNDDGLVLISQEEINKFPLPARHLIDTDSYHYFIEGKRALSLISQFGCPYGCNFCSGRSSFYFRKVRNKTPKNIVDEMVYLYKTYGNEGFMFYDDELNVRKDLIDLMELISETQEKLGARWYLRGFIKANLFTDKQAKAMYQAGFRWILTGFESGSEKILNIINKQSGLEENTQCIEIAHNNNLKVKALMSIGHPGESMETIEQTKNWLLKVKPDDFDITIITVYPGSPLYDEAKQDVYNKSIWIYTDPKTGEKQYQKEIDYTFTAHYFKGIPNIGYYSYVYTDYLSDEELVSFRDKTEEEVRFSLGIPYPTSASVIDYEHSMGQRSSFKKIESKK